MRPGAAANRRSSRSGFCNGPIRDRLQRLEADFVVDIALEQAQADVARYIERTQLMVARQEQRIDRLRALGLPTDDALDTLDVLKGTLGSLEYFRGLLDGLLRQERQSRLSFSTPKAPS